MRTCLTRISMAPVGTRKSEKEKRKRAESIVEGGGQSVVGQHVGDGAVERSEIVVAVKAAKRTCEGTAEGDLLGTQESR